MNARQLIVSSVAALSVVGSVGFAYAQSTTEPVGSGSAAATPAGRVDGTTNSNTSASTVTPNSGSTSTPSSTAESSTSSGLPAQADRG